MPNTLSPCLNSVLLPSTTTPVRSDSAPYGYPAMKAGSIPINMYPLQRSEIFVLGVNDHGSHGVESSGIDFDEDITGRRCGDGEILTEFESLCGLPATND